MQRVPTRTTNQMTVDNKLPTQLKNKTVELNGNQQF